MQDNAKSLSSDPIYFGEGLRWDIQNNMEVRNCRLSPLLFRLMLILLYVGLAVCNPHTVLSKTGVGTGAVLDSRVLVITRVGRFEPAVVSCPGNSLMGVSSQERLLAASRYNILS